MTDMTDDPMQDPSVLASAYLDGEVTPDERARVEADPTLLAEVDRLRQVRSLVAADVSPAPLSVREAHLAAALDVWDQLGDVAAAAVTPLEVGRARRARRADRRRSGERAQWLLGAAAGLVVLAGVGAVVRGVIIGGDQDDEGADIAASEPAEDAADAIGPPEEDIAATLEGSNTGDELRLEIDPDEVASAAAEEPAEEPAEAPADEPMEEAAEEEEAMDEAMEEAGEDDAGAETSPAGAGDDADDGEVSEPTDTPPETDLVVLVTPQDLADYTAPAAYAPEPLDDDLEAAFADCGDEPPVGLGIDRLAAPAIVDGELVLIGADLDDGIAYAFRNDCSVVLDALLPTEEEYLAGLDTAPSTTAAP